MSPEVIDGVRKLPPHAQAPLRGRITVKPACKGGKSLSHRHSLPEVQRQPGFVSIAPASNLALGSKRSTLC